MPKPHAIQFLPVRVTTYLDATITREQAVALAVELLDKVCDLQGADRITKEGFLAHSETEERIRPMSAEDLAALNVRAKLLAYGRDGTLTPATP